MENKQLEGALYLNTFCEKALLYSKLIINKADWCLITVTQVNIFRVKGEGDY